MDKQDGRIFFSILKNGGLHGPALYGDAVGIDKVTALDLGKLELVFQSRIKICEPQLCAAGRIQHIKFAAVQPPQS